MSQFSNIAQHYKYTDMTSWDIADRVDLNSKELMLVLDAALNEDCKSQLDISILAFHYIWNHKNNQLTQQILEKLLKSDSGIMHPFYYFLNAKLCHFNSKYYLSLEFLNLAEEGLQKGMDGNLDYRRILTCIGSLNNEDPKNIEYTVMKAIIKNEIGNNYHALGMYDKAIDAFISALNFQQKSYSTMRHLNVAYTHRCMGKSLERKGMSLEAFEQYEQANSIIKETIDECHPESIEIKAALSIYRDVV